MEPGWHPDPSRKFDQRYYDGTRWTDHVARGGEMMRDLPAPPVPPRLPPLPPPEPAEKRGWAKWAFVAIVVLTILGVIAAFAGSDDDDKTVTVATSTEQQAPVSAAAATATTTIPAKPATTTTIRPFAEYRDQVIDLIEGFGDRVDTIDMVPDGDRQVLRINYTSSYSTADYVSHQGWEIATKLTDLWDGDESNGSGLNLDLTVANERKTLRYHYVCKGEVMDRVKARRIVEADWVTACKA